MSVLHAFGGDLDALLSAFGYGAVALLVFLESSGIPSPGETILITAGAYAGATHRLDIALVILTAFLAATFGDNCGYWVGRLGGWRLVRRYGHLLRVDDGTFKVAIYLFRRYGAPVVFIGRFLPVLRIWGALLAGTTRYPWRAFLIWNASSAALWATAWGLLAYAFGHALRGMAGNISAVALGVALLISVAAGFAARARWPALRAEAERALPGHLDGLADRDTGSH